MLKTKVIGVVATIVCTVASFTVAHHAKAVTCYAQTQSCTGNCPEGYSCVKTPSTLGNMSSSCSEREYTSAGGHCGGCISSGGIPDVPCGQPKVTFDSACW